MIQTLWNDITWCFENVYMSTAGSLIYIKMYKYIHSSRCVKGCQLDPLDLINLDLESQFSNWQSVS